MSEFEFIKCVMYGVYLMMAFMAWIFFTFWLHDEKEELNENWFAAMSIAALLSLVWPISLFFWWRSTK